MSKSVKHFSRAGLFLFVAFAFCLAIVPQNTFAQTGGKTFSETGKAVAADFYTYWQAHGGLALNGLPVTDEKQEVSFTDGKSYATQWFERARYERHPENPAGNQVLLGLLGVSAAEGRNFDKTSDTSSTASRVYFKETGHSAANTPAPFLDYWNKNGGLAQFGFPLSEQAQEVSTDGKTYTVQYFERQRFEFHPEQSDAQFKVLLGLLGVQQYKQQYTAKRAAVTGDNNQNQIVIGLSQEPPSLASWLETAAVTADVNAGIEDGIIEYNDNGEAFAKLGAYVPSLDNGAAFFQGTGENRQLVVKWKLRRGIKWADNVELTAKDAVFYHNFLLNENLEVSDRSIQQKFASVVAVDDYTVVGTFLSQKQAQDLFKNAKTPDDKATYAVYEKQDGPLVDPTFFFNLAVYPEHAYAKVDPKDMPAKYGNNPLGTGPYKVKEKIAGQAIILEPNPYYNVTDAKPAIKNVVFKVIEDTNQLLAQLQTGQIDIGLADALNVPNIPAIDELAKGGKTKGYYTPGTTHEHVDFNLRKPMFQDVKVRQAIRYAINRQRVVDQVLFGKSVVSHSWITPNIKQYYNPNVPKFAYDVAKSDALMKDAGFAKGADGIWAKGDMKMSFKYTTTAGNALRAQTTQLVAGDLKAAGFNATLEYIPAKVYFAGGADGTLSSGNFDFAEFAWLASYDPSGLVTYSSAGIPSAANGFEGQNYMAYSSAENDRLLGLVNNNAEIALDPAKRQKLYFDQQVLYANDVPSIELFLRPEVVAAPTGLKNFKPTGSSVSATWNIQEWRLTK